MCMQNSYKKPTELIPLALPILVFPIVLLILSMFFMWYLPIFIKYLAERFYLIIAALLLSIFASYPFVHDMHCVHVENYSINTDHLLFSSFCKIYSVIAIFLAALVGYNTNRLKDEAKSIRTSLALALTASSALLSTDLSSLGGKILDENIMIESMIKNYHFLIDLSLHVFGAIIGCLACSALLNKKLKVFYFPIVADFD